MKHKKLLSLILTFALVAGLAGCGAKSYSNGASADGAIAETWAASAPQAAADMGLTEEQGMNSSTAMPESRKWIVTVNMSAETDDLDAMSAALDEKIASLGGYVENQSVYNGSAYGGRRYRSASLTIRVPAQDVDSFTGGVAEISNVVRKEKNLEDVTLQYVDTESRKKALETEQTRLLELLSQAENMTDLLEIEGRLTEVRAELERTASRLRLYDNQIDYATVYLSIEEVQEYTPVEEPTLWERISKGFKDNLEGVGDDLLDVLVWLIVSIPYLVVLAVVVVIVVLIVKRIRRRRAAKKAAKQQKPEES